MPLDRNQQAAVAKRKLDAANSEIYFCIAAEKATDFIDDFLLPYINGKTADFQASILEVEPDDFAIQRAGALELVRLRDRVQELCNKEYRDGLEKRIDTLSGALEDHGKRAAS